MAKDGGPAFPVWHGVTKQLGADTGGSPGPFAALPKIDYPSGMSLRDWFASQAIPVARYQREDETDAQIAASMARYCYLLADALLAEREK